MSFLALSHRVIYEKKTDCASKVPFKRSQLMLAVLSTMIVLV